MPDQEAKAWKPKVVFVDGDNRAVETEREHEVGGQSLLRKVTG
jgi:aspartate 1-decarboxylase